jgi:hypothetical protein
MKLAHCVLGALALAACSSNSANRIDMGGGSQTCTPDGKTQLLASRYAVQALLELHVSVQGGAIVDKDVEGKLILLADVTQNGTSATLSAKQCAIGIPPVPLMGGNKPVQLSASTALVQSVPAVTTTSTLSDTQSCANFNAQAITLTVGTHLANVGSDPLPVFATGGATRLCGNMATTACNPPPSDTGCVCDQEADGKLGATLDAVNVPGYDDVHKVYVDLRTSVTLAGKVYPQGANQATPGPRLVGEVMGLKLEQQVLGCRHVPDPPGTPSECTETDVGAVVAFNPVITPSATTPSPFLAVPVDAAATCDSVAAAAATLFGS